MSTRRSFAAITTLNEQRREDAAPGHQTGAGGSKQSDSLNWAPSLPANSQKVARPATASHATRSGTDVQGGFADYQQSMREAVVTARVESKVRPFRAIHSAPGRRTAPESVLPESVAANPVGTALGDLHIADRNPIYWKAYTKNYHPYPKIGPGSYEPGIAKDKTKKRMHVHSFGSSTRMGQVQKNETELEDDVVAMERLGHRARKGGRLFTPAKNLPSVEAASTIAAGFDSSQRASSARRPHTATTKYKRGAGHWTEGVMTGTTIAGCVSRDRAIRPGVGRYNAGQAKDVTSPRTQRASFGTSPRFPGERIIPRPPVEKKGPIVSYKAAAGGP